MTNDDASQLREIARELRRLQRSSPGTNDAMPAWYEESRRFADDLALHFSGVDLPEEVWHYLHDADLRAKDPGYRRMQDQAIDAVIADLERGVVPPPRGATITFHPRWLGAAGVALVCLLIYWMTR